MLRSFGVVLQTRCQCTKEWWNCLPEVFIDFSRGAIRSFVICQGLCYLASDKKLYKSQLELMGCLVVLLKHITGSTTLQARKTAVLLLGHRGRGRVSKYIQDWLEMGRDPVWWAPDPFLPADQAWEKICHSFHAFPT